MRSNYGWRKKKPLLDPSAGFYAALAAQGEGGAVFELVEPLHGPAFEIDLGGVLAEGALDFGAGGGGEFLERGLFFGGGERGVGGDFLGIGDGGGAQRVEAVRSVGSEPEASGGGDGRGVVLVLFELGGDVALIADNGADLLVE